MNERPASGKPVADANGHYRVSPEENGAAGVDQAQSYKMVAVNVVSRPKRSFALVKADDQLRAKALYSGGPSLRRAPWVMIGRIIVAGVLNQVFGAAWVSSL